MDNERQGLIEPDNEKAKKLFKKELQTLKDEIEEEHSMLTSDDSDNNLRYKSLYKKYTKLDEEHDLLKSLKEKENEKEKEIETKSNKKYNDLLKEYDSLKSLNKKEKEIEMGLKKDSINLEDQSKSSIKIL